MAALGVLLMATAILIGVFFVVCALLWLLPSQVSKIILPARTTHA